MLKIILRLKTFDHQSLLSGRIITFLLVTLLITVGIQGALRADTGQLLFEAKDIKDVGSLAVKLQDTRAVISQYIAAQLSAETQQLLEEYDGISRPSPDLQKALIANLNRLLEAGSLYDALSFVEKAALRNDLLKEKQEKINNKMLEALGVGQFTVTEGVQEKLAGIRAPVEEEYRQKFQDQADKIDREYQREQNRQEQLGETFSRITPTSSLLYLAMNLARTGKLKRDIYFQTGNRYYNQLDQDYFKDISDDALAQMRHLTGRAMARMNPSAASSKSETEKIPPAPNLTESSLKEALEYSLFDVLLLCFFAIVLTTVAFLKFFRLDV